jgi:hypothetical protein
MVVGIIACAGPVAAEDAPATAPSGAVSGDPNGRAIIDTETSARREAEFEETPYLPQVFAHQGLSRSHHDPDAPRRNRDGALTVPKRCRALLTTESRPSACPPASGRPLAEAIFDPILPARSARSEQGAELLGAPGV